MACNNCVCSKDGRDEWRHRPSLMKEECTRCGKTWNEIFACECNIVKSPQFRYERKDVYA